MSDENDKRMWPQTGRAASLAYVDHENLMVWGKSRNIHPDIIGFLNAFGRMTNSGLVYTDQEGWEEVSKIISTEFPQSDRSERLTAILGEVGATHFIKFHEFAQTVPSTDAILSGDVLEYKMDTSLAQAVSTLLLGELKKRIEYIKISWGADFRNTDAFKDWCKSVNNTFVFVDRNMVPEMFILFTRSSIHEHALPYTATDIPALREIARKYAGWVVN